MLRVIAFCLLLAGCVTRPEMHDSWADQVQVGEGQCPDIDGVYRNAGDRSILHFTLGATASLAHLLNGEFESFEHRNEARLGTTWSNPERDPVRAIRVIHLGDTLRFETMVEGGRGRTLELRTSETCQKSLVTPAEEWPHEYPGVGEPVDAAYGLAFGRLADGSLLVRTSTKFPTPGLGYRLVLFAEYFNYRFAPAD
jgi:hypothetical protein